ncbi:hypothetical protein ANCCAN_11396 [Ancylostoma caninum]|uniref:G-protein coupled receptors family 1 profile domain-containing protein n=1 Tax=Ancylostoma caninum TaxID=29170 RepID=A0A368GE34_ANCCA|nr:hypothetical protein ANCCAN_11396 [Ancylostoma caninum]
MNDEHCLSEGVDIARNIYYICAQVLQILVNLATIAFIISTRKYLLQYRVHNSVKVIFCALCGCICLHCLVFVTFQVQHLFTALTAANPCDIFQSPIYCVVIRFVMRSVCNYFVLLQVGFCIDRTTATVFTKTYEVSRFYLGALICILAAISSLAAAALTDWSSENNEPLISCLNNNKDNWIAVDIWNYVFMATNITAFLWVCIIFLINRKMHKRWERNI